MLRRVSIKIYAYGPGQIIPPEPVGGKYLTFFYFDIMMASLVLPLRMDMKVLRKSNRVAEVETVSILILHMIRVLPDLFFSPKILKDAYPVINKTTGETKDLRMTLLNMSNGKLTTLTGIKTGVKVSQYNLQHPKI